MPFELGAKKAGLSLVRAFLHSIEGVRPYKQNYLEPYKSLSRNAIPSHIDSKPTVMAKSLTCKVKHL